MVFDMVWHKKRHWRNVVLSVLTFPIVFGYLIKTTHSTTYSSFHTEVNEDPLEYKDAGELSLLTYNVAGLPDFLSSASCSRAKSMKEIAKKINRFDIVNVQEDFHYHRELYGDRNEHRFRTVHKVAVPYGDGLNTLSKYPIRETRRIPWQHCSGSDCLAAKGFSFARIEFAKGISVDVYNVHATAQNDKYATIARKKNLQQLARYIGAQSAGNAIIVMGDFNAHFEATWDNMDWFAQKTGLEDVWTILQKGGVCPFARADFVSKEKLTLTDSCESIDKILFRNSAQLEFFPSGYKVEKQYFTNSNGVPLSDHYAISCVLQWRKNSR